MIDSGNNPSRSIAVAVFAPYYPPAARGGGPIRSTEALIRHAPRRYEPFVVTSDRDHGSTSKLDVPSNRWTLRDGVAVRYSAVSRPGGTVAAITAARRRRPQMLYFNSFMNPSFTILPMLLHRVGFWGRSTTAIIAPRGEFGEGALGRRPLKKRLYMGLFRALRMHRSVVWHSTAPHETEDIRSLWGSAAPIVERGNDSLLGARALPPSMNHGVPIRLVFVGRIVEHKGIAIVIEALAGTTRPVSLDIFGVQEDPDYFARCTSLAANAGPHATIRFHGALAPEEVVPTLNRFDALVLATRGENFGHIIAESLAASCIVMTTPTTPWTDGLRHGGGTIVADRSVEAWRRSIDALAALPAEEIHSRRARAAKAYEAWAAQPPAPHVWDLTRELLAYSRDQS